VARKKLKNTKNATKWTTDSVRGRFKVSFKNVKFLNTGLKKIKVLIINYQILKLNAILNI
jgi:hypothetical protein